MDESTTEKKFQIGIVPVKINDKEYFSTDQFGALCGLSTKQINHLILHGNRVRKLRSILFHGSRFVPVEEMKEFPFSTRGRYGWRATGNAAAHREYINPNAKEKTE